MKKYIIEFIGAFFLVLTIALTGNPIAIGFVLVALVYMGGYISGGHYNPAVTLAILLTKNIKPPTALVYMLVQLAGGIAAALVYSYVHAGKFIPAMNPNATMSQAILLETIFTFLLCSVVLHVAVAKETKGNNYFGLAIGLTVMVGAFAAGPISGGAFNPAVGIGPLLADFGNIAAHTDSLLLYLIGPFLGSIIAAFIYKLK